MENDVVVKGGKMVTSNHRTLFERGKILFPFHSVDDHNILLDKIQEIMVAEEVCNSSFYLARKLLTKIVYLLGQKLGRFGIVFNGIVKKPRAFLLSYLVEYLLTSGRYLR